MNLKYQLSKLACFQFLILSQLVLRASLVLPPLMHLDYLKASDDTKRALNEDLLNSL